jgi:hypothetical protein
MEQMNPVFFYWLQRYVFLKGKTIKLKTKSYAKRGK